jgi:hypothetical protein
LSEWSRPGLPPSSEIQHISLSMPVGLGWTQLILAVPRRIQESPPKQLGVGSRDAEARSKDARFCVGRAGVRR